MVDKLEVIASLDKKIHEPARLAIMMVLYVADKADLLYLMNQTKLTKGNLSSHLSNLEEAGYIEVAKTIKGKTTHTLCSLTDAGRKAFDEYRRSINGVFNDPLPE
jgi:DNA-binding MarR family transcriptional regulator